MEDSFDRKAKIFSDSCHDTNKNAYVWCHATSPACLIGVLKLGIVAPTCWDQIWMDRSWSGFFGTATYNLTEENENAFCSRQVNVQPHPELKASQNRIVVQKRCMHCSSGTALWPFPVNTAEWLSYASCRFPVSSHPCVC